VNTSRRRSTDAVAVARDFVLVHGAWHGGWCWSRLAPKLRVAGRRVYCPSLTGLGDRAHLFGSSVTLATHVEDVVALIEAEELHDFVLVGHSYGGNVITGVADRLRERVAHYVYLDAVVPLPGAATWRWADFNTPEDRQARLNQIREHGAGVALPAPAPQVFGVTDLADVQWLRRRLGPMPVGTYVGEIRLSNGGAEGLPRTYIAADNPPFRPMQPTCARLRADPGWRFLTIDTGHDMMVTAPEDLATLLLAL